MRFLHKLQKRNGTGEFDVEANNERLRGKAVEGDHRLNIQVQPLTLAVSEPWAIGQMNVLCISSSGRPLVFGKLPGLTLSLSYLEPKLPCGNEASRGGPLKYSTHFAAKTA